MSLDTSSLVNGLKKVRFDGTWLGMVWGDVWIDWDLRPAWSLITLSEKKVANLWGRDLESMLDGSRAADLRWRRLLIVFQSLRGLEEDEEMSEELKTFLAWIMAEWYVLVALRNSLRSRDERVRSQIFSRWRRADLSLDNAGVNQGLGGLARMVPVLSDACSFIGGKREYCCTSQQVEID